jgi:PAS domain S-box-containing protein
MESEVAVGGKAVRRGFYSTVLPWLVLGAGIPASFLLSALIKDSLESVAQLRFEREVNNANYGIDDRLGSYADILVGLRALFASASSVDRLRFHRFVESLDLKHRFPGFDSLNYAAYIPVRDKDRFEESVRRDRSLDPKGYPGFRIKPPGLRPEYYVIEYLEPMAGYEFAFGLDIAANPAADPRILLAALRSARDSGQLTASGQPLRIKGEKESVYLAMRLAVYRNGMPVDTVEQRRAAYIGSVGAGINVGRLMKDAVNEEMLRNVRIRLYDTGPTGTLKAPEETHLMFDSDQLVSPDGATNENPASIFSYSLPMKLGGRVFEFRYSAPKDLGVSRLDKLWPTIVFAGGLLSSLLVFGVLYSLSSSRSQAIKLAAQITEILRVSEERFRLISENASDLITLLDEKNRRLYVNPVYRKLFGDCDALAIGADGLEVVHPEDRERIRQLFDAAVRDGVDWRTELRLVLPSGEIRYIESHGNRVYSEQGRGPLVVVVARDVTDRRLTEEDLRNYADRLRAVSGRLVEVQEAERRLLATELHDRVGQNLTALGLSLRLVASGVSKGVKPDAAARLEECEALLKSTVDSIRNVMGELRPQVLDDYGLLAALRSHAGGFSRRTGIHVSVDGAAMQDELPKSVDVAMFRIAQEALNNVAKHSKAKRVDIALSRANGHAKLSIRDDGIGFDPRRVEAANPDAGWGLLIMRERAEAVGAKLNLYTTPGSGVRVLVEYRI